MITIDKENGFITFEENGKSTIIKIGSKEGFRIISELWLRSGWDTKYVYSFTWMGRPIIQLPEDLIRIQEVIFSLKPDIIIETGIAHGGSLIFYASLCKSIEKGRVVGIDIEIRSHNRNAIESHFLFPFITLIEGSSIDPSIVNTVKSLIKPNDTVFIMLDSCHTKNHVLHELQMYSPLVNIGSYIVAADGIMGNIVGAPRSYPDWHWNNPKEAAIEFVKQNPDYIIEEPPFLFNEGLINERVTYWPCAFIKRIR